MYYKSFMEYLKEKETENRVKFIEETSSNDSYMARVQLLPSPNLHCPECNSLEIIKFGKKSRTVHDDFVTNRDTLIIVDYNRFKCKNCNKLFNDKLDYFDKNESISLSKKLNILEDLKMNISYTDIATMKHVSTQTVINIFENNVSFDRVPFGDVICMDEFKNLKHSKGKYAFVMYDPNAQLINDVLEDRHQETIREYLFKVSWDEKNKVKYVITDMSESYRTIIRRHFINATHIVDAFHFSRYVSQALNNVRLRIQSKFTTKTPQYKILKRNWSLLLKKQCELIDASYYNPIEKIHTSIYTIIDDMLEIDDELRVAYDLSQSFFSALDNVKYEDSKEWLDKWIETLNTSKIKEFHELKSMFKNWYQEILNSFIRFGDKRLHNGHIEGMNNKIKVIKRVAFGYKNFEHFRKRIMFIVNQKYSLKK